MRADRALGLSLGWRWFSRPADSNRPLRLRRILAAGLAVWVSLLAITLWQANGDRTERGENQQPGPIWGAPASESFRVHTTDTPFRSDLWSTVFMSGHGATPPGLNSFPAPGTAYVSPAVQRAIAADPSLAARVPGRIVGTIGSAGLQSPDQYYVYVNTAPGPDWRRVDGWGTPGLAAVRPSVPPGPLIGLMAILMGIPAALLTRATARMSALSRQRSLAAAHLLGAPTRTLATAAAFDAALCATVGAALGVVACAATVWLTHASTILGLSWYAPVTLVSPLAALVCWLLVAAVTTRDAHAIVVRDLHNPTLAGAGGPRRARRWAVIPLAIVLAGMLGVVATLVFGRLLSNTLSATYLFIGVPVAMLAAFVGLPTILDRASKRLRARSASPTAFLAIRRLSWRRDSVAASAIGLLIVASSSVIGAAVLADLSHMSPVSAEGDTYSVQLLDAETGPRILSEVAGRQVLQTRRGPRLEIYGDCPDVISYLTSIKAAAGAAIAQQCRDGAVLKVPDRFPGLQNRTFHIDTNPTLAGAGRVSILAQPGADPGAVDRYFTATLAIAPQAAVSNTTADPYRPMVVPTHRLLVMCSGAGLLTALVMLLLTSLDAHRRTLADAARLVALGAPSPYSAKVQALTFGIGAGITCALGLVIGWLGGLIYDQVGGLVPSPGQLGLMFSALALAITGAVVAVLWLVLRRTSIDNPMELLQVE